MKTNKFNEKNYTQKLIFLNLLNLIHLLLSYVPNKRERESENKERESRQTSRKIVKKRFLFPSSKLFKEDSRRSEKNFVSVSEEREEGRD
jgi:hypothetical protein